VKRSASWLLAVVAAVALLPSPLPAQVQPQAANQRQIIDGIAAIVGGEIILRSDVELRYLFHLQEQRIEPNSLTEAEIEEIHSDILQELIDQTLIVARALRDSIVVERSEVEEAIDQWLAQLRENLGGEGALQQQLQMEGLTVPELRRRRRPMVRNQLLQAKLFQELGIGRPTAVSRREAAEFIRQHADELLVLRHLMLEPPPDLDPDTVTRHWIEKLWERIVNGGEDFAAIARQYSDDPGSGPLGGDLGEAPRGTYMTSVDSTVWNQPVGEVSRPVRSQLGWHLIQVLARSQQRAHARHILIRGDTEGIAIRALADTISLVETALREGESFVELVGRFSDEEDAVERTGYYGMLPLPVTAATSGLPTEWVEALQSLEEGDWAGPLEMSNNIHFVQRILVDESTVDLILRSDFPRIEIIVQRIRSEGEVEAWLQELRRETYIEIKKL